MIDCLYQKSLEYQINSILKRNFIKSFAKVVVTLAVYFDYFNIIVTITIITIVNL